MHPRGTAVSRAVRGPEGRVSHIPRPRSYLYCTPCTRHHQSGPATPRPRSEGPWPTLHPSGHAGLLTLSVTSLSPGGVQAAAAATTTALLLSVSKAHSGTPPNTPCFRCPDRGAHGSELGGGAGFSLCLPSPSPCFSGFLLLPLSGSSLPLPGPECHAAQSSLFGPLFFCLYAHPGDLRLSCRGNHHPCADDFQIRSSGPTKPLHSGLLGTSV